MTNSVPANQVRFIRAFNLSESKNIAFLVGFNPNSPGLAHDCLVDTNQYWRFPPNISDIDQSAAIYCLSLGLFIHWKYTENNLPIPKPVREWYDRNNAIASADALFVRSEVRS